MARALRSTVLPCRASLYSGWPSCLSAEYIGGTCSISPSKPRRAAFTAASSRVKPSTLAITSPSLSAVSVRSPSFIRARYALSESSKNCDTLVASPKHSGNTPVASGSKLPVWPALFASNKRFTTCSARFELPPSGLSNTTMPCMCRPFCFLRATLSYCRRQADRRHAGRYRP